MRDLRATALALVVAAGALVAPASASWAVPSVQAAARPPIQKHLIHFPKSRKRQTAAYSRRHYGTASWRLEPKTIVQHYTASNSLAGVFATFESNAPDPELRELPGVCTHFVIDQDGTIYQVVPLRIRCRHTVGLNYAAIGIEHVGVSDGQVMSNRRQRRASLKLTAWLMGRYDIATGDVIGHNESIRSRFHRELYRSWRCQTHGDFSHSTMKDYRRRLRVIAQRQGLRVTWPHWVDRGC